MRFLNFALGEGTHPIEIKAVGLIWDLHNVMDFARVTQDISANSVEMHWQVNRAYALQEYPAELFSILFSDIEYFEIKQRDDSLPHSEDNCLASISRIHSTESWEIIEKYGGAPPLEEITGEDFHLLFEFQGGQRIRIGAQIAEFRVLNQNRQ